MKTGKFLLAIAFIATTLFVSCSPNSVADEDNLYTEGVEKAKIKVSDIR